MIKYSKFSPTKVFLLFASLVYLANFVSGGIFMQNLTLVPKLVLKNYDFWRIFTFPFTINSFESFLLFAVSFYFFAPKIENYFNKNVFLLSCGLVSVLFGLTSTMFFAGNNYIFSGFEQVSLFILFLHSLLNLNKKLNFFDKVYIPVSILSTSVITSWVFFKSVSFIYVGGALVPHLIYPISFGFLVAVGFYLRILILNYTKIEKDEKIPNFQAATKQELEHAYVSQDEVRRIVKKIEDDFTASYPLESDLSEENLNEILDKILESGKESLTEAENNFLEFYSKHLK